MKSGIHPEYVVAQVSCACGNTFTTRSTKPVLKQEICAACHPFYTGQQKLLDTAGRVERFAKRFAKTGGKMIERAPVLKTVKPPMVTKAPKVKVLSTAPTTKKAKEPKPAKKAA